MAGARFWTNRSVLALAKGKDPIEATIERSRSLILESIEAGWAGPPFDPFMLADYWKIHVVPREDIKDARTLFGNKTTIEYNPNKPLHRIRYSIAHELAHTIFPNTDKQTKNRLAHEDMSGDDWQLEILCNIAAAEILMPIGSFLELKDQALSIDNLSKLRLRFGVSWEALLLRVAKLTDQQSGIFCSSRRIGYDNDRYKIDYSLFSKAWQNCISAGALVPKGSILEQCTAIGFTAKGREVWPGINTSIDIQCIGIPPYPNQLYPRVVGILLPTEQEHSQLDKPLYLKGDATQPRGNGYRIIAHIVNDRASTWGAGFAKCVREKWPSVQEEFKNWAHNDKQKFSLGHIHFNEIEESLGIVHMISQHGYGPSRTPGIRYMALKVCLDQLAVIAMEKTASIHMPRIGCGEARGRWDIIKELIEETLCAKGIQVIIYDLPDQPNYAHEHSPGLFAHEGAVEDIHVGG